jgi:hypothetical protein
MDENRQECLLVPLISLDLVNQLRVSRALIRFIWVALDLEADFELVRHESAPNGMLRRFDNESMIRGHDVVAVRREVFLLLVQLSP